MDTAARGRSWELLRAMVRGTYDIQEIRIQMGNRLVGNFKVKLGIAPGTKEDDLSDKKKQNVLSVLRREYQRITDGVIKLNPSGDGIISTKSEMILVGHYVDLAKQEERQFRGLNKLLAGFPIWNSYLSDVKGVGPAIGAILISEIDITKAKYPSSLWAYSGLDVATDPKRAHAPDGQGRSRRKEHLMTVKYVNKDGEEKTRNSITFNPLLKTKLIGVLGPSFLRAGVPCDKDCTKKGCEKRGEHNTGYGSPYGEVYANERHRLQNHPDHKEKTKGHQHAMATRKAVKIFLIDLYKVWREMESLPVSKPYHESKLGMQQHKQAS